MTAVEGSVPEMLGPFSWTITQAQIDAYAAAAGANDPIHVDPAAATPLGGTIAQGMLVLAVMAEFIGNALHDATAWRCSGALDVRFRAPARPGDRLVVRAKRIAARVDEFGAYELWCENADGVRIVAGSARIPLAAFSR
ncbi:MAG: MaoC family dehydratase [Betaproteobacteria bacterium]|nr:MaoC family dehydratase [Betaproteobacteria bacterium]